MKKLLSILFMFVVLFASSVMTACGSEETHPMCDCEIDEMCIDETCVKYPDDFAPAPED